LKANTTDGGDQRSASVSELRCIDPEVGSHPADRPAWKNEHQAEDLTGILQAFAIPLFTELLILRL